jgi:hypothetical protein
MYAKLVSSGSNIGGLLGNCYGGFYPTIHCFNFGYSPIYDCVVVGYYPVYGICTVGYN